jgi:sec-independent protein translocase protein TatA
MSLLTIFLAMPGTTEWIFIILAIVLLFGGKKIPELMRGLGKGIREFKDAKDNVKNELEEGMKQVDKDQEIKDLRKQLEQQKQQG